MRSFADHIADRRAVTARRVVDEDVRHGSDQFTVLHDRAAAHSLHDASRFVQQLFVGHFDDEIFVLLVCFGLIFSSK